MTDRRAGDSATDDRAAGDPAIGDRAAGYRLSGWWRDGTFTDDLRRAARGHPDRTAMVVRRLADGSTRTMDYAELDRLADRCAGALLELGVRRGDVMAMQFPNRWELAPLMLGCWRAGAVLCSLSAHYRRRELRHALGLTAARVFITQAELSGEDRTGMVGELAAELGERTGRAPRVFFDGFADFFLGTPWEERRPVREAARQWGPDEPCMIIFTSGTTGEPKGSLHSQNTLYAPIRGEAEVFGLGSGDVITMAGFYGHYTGLVRGLLMPFALGATTAFQEGWDGPDTLDLIERHRVTFLYSVPGVVLDLVEAQRAAPRDIGSLKHLVSGSAPVPSQLVADVREVLGRRLYSLWGMTENGAVTITRPDDPADWAAHSDGRPISDMEVRIDPIKGRDDGVGTLWVRGPTQCLGYYRRAELYEADLDDDGWFNTGDLARDDGRGGIRIAGRAKELIQRFGIPVSAVEVEDVLTRHPKVREAAVVGIPDPAQEEIVCAVVTAAPGGEPVTLDELREHFRAAGMSEVYWPGRLEIVAALPRTVTGKVRKDELRRRYGAP